MNVPEWWLVLSGIFFGMSILLVVFLCVVALVLMGLIRELTTSVKSLGTKAEQIGDRVETLVEKVQSVTNIVGQRASSISTNVDIVTSGIARKVDLVATALLVLTTIGRIGKRMRK